MEIQVNGGTVAEKVDFAVGMFEKSVNVDGVFAEGECLDICTATKGKGICWCYLSLGCHQTTS